MSEAEITAKAPLVAFLEGIIGLGPMCVESGLREVEIRQLLDGAQVTVVLRFPEQPGGAA